ncbi:MAG: outer membrane beta-barrel protein [Bacteroidales bacterium]|jgi:hypothetical protein
MNLKRVISNKQFIVTLMTICYFSFANASFAQTFNYGVNIGVGSFNQKWELPNWSDKYPGWNKEKIGMTFHIFGELEHGSHFGTKLELGYIRKGFTQDLSFEKPDGTIDYYEPRKANYNTITIGISENIYLLKSKFNPYIKLGINTNVILNKDFKNSTLVIRDGTGSLLIVGDYPNSLDWNNITFNGILGLGVTFEQLLFVELEYIPAITKLIDMKYIKIYDRCIGLTVGININQLF